MMRKNVVLRAGKGLLPPRSPGLQEAELTFPLCTHLSALITAPPRLHPEPPCLPELPGSPAAEWLSAGTQ